LERPDVVVRRDRGARRRPDIDGDHLTFAEGWNGKAWGYQAS
jgi:hypothetical protein